MKKKSQIEKATEETARAVLSRREEHRASLWVSTSVSSYEHCFLDGGGRSPFTFICNEERAPSRSLYIYIFFVALHSPSLPFPCGTN